MYPDAIIACPLLLMNGRVSTDILCKALPYDIDEVSWKMIFDNLYPLVIPSNTEKEYALFHNDFRVFLMRVIRNYETRYKEIAYYIAQYLLDNQVGKETYMLGIPLVIMGVFLGIVSLSKATVGGATAMSVATMVEVQCFYGHGIIFHKKSKSYAAMALLIGMAVETKII